ncbi:MAG: helix-turn-helix transcriptional regulator [Gemmatimonadaceae bacterium]|nr:helix-turn-helix transcriptional regulator [Gemmatimonadaceae bacterium]
MSARRGGAASDAPHVVACAAREHTRTLLRKAFSRRGASLRFCRTAAELQRAFSRELVDAAFVDVGSGTDEAWKAARLAVEYPCTPFFGFAALRVTDAPAIARCADAEFADVLAEGIDGHVLRELVAPHAFTTRFAAAVVPAGDALGFRSRLQREAWAMMVEHGGRPIRTDRLARALGLSREHLSRSFAAGGAPNLKRVMDLVRVIAAAELSKCPGYDSAAVARVLQFASASHLASTAQRVCGTRAASLARLRAGDILERFQQQGRGRSHSRG